MVYYQYITETEPPDHYYRTPVRGSGRLQPVGVKPAKFLPWQTDCLYCQYGAFYGAYVYRYDSNQMHESTCDAITPAVVTTHFQRSAQYLRGDYGFKPPPK